jgi:hypothetical protein
MVRQVTKGRGRPGKPTNYRPAVIRATLERRDSSSSVCFQFGQYGDGNSEHSPNSREPRSMLWLVGVTLLYMTVGGAILRTLYYQYQINELSAEMVDATNLRQANLERLDQVRKEMGLLSEEMNELKQKNTGLRKEQRDRGAEERIQAHGENAAESDR